MIEIIVCLIIGFLLGVLLTTWFDSMNIKKPTDTEVILIIVVVVLIFMLIGVVNENMRNTGTMFWRERVIKWKPLPKPSGGGG